MCLQSLNKCMFWKAWDLVFEIIGSSDVLGGMFFLYFELMRVLILYLYLAGIPLRGVIFIIHLQLRKRYDVGLCEDF